MRRKQIREILDHSGFLLEQRACDVITAGVKDLLYVVQPNWNFQDQDTGESREIDIHALSGHRVLGGKVHFLFPVIIADCVNNQHPWVFFAQERLVPGEFGDVMPYLTGVPRRIRDGRKELDVGEYFRLHEFHHYQTSKWDARQFCRVTPKEATHGNIYNGVVVPLVKGVSFEMENHLKTLGQLPPTNAKAKPPTIDEINVQVYYPTIILGGALFECRLSASGRQILRRREHVLLVRHYHSKSITERAFAIDVITESFLSKFLGMVDSECSRFIGRMKRKRKLIERNLAREDRETRERFRRKK